MTNPPQEEHVSIVTESIAIRIPQLFQRLSASELGFVGTRAGMSPKQHALVRDAIRYATPTVVRHAAGFGSDDTFHALVGDIHPQVMRDIWPADVKQFNRYRHHASVHIHSPMDHRVCMEEVVKRSTFLIITPHTNAEDRTANTWQAARVARRAEIPILVIWPNGKMTLDYRKHLTRVVP